MINARDRILRPYTRRVHDLRHSLMKTLAVFLLIMTAMFMGFWLAVFGTLVAQPFFLLVGVLFLIALWMMDDTEPDYRAAITSLLMWYIVMEAIWPSYLALDIPGLPWITPPRILLFFLVFSAVLQFSQSSVARLELTSIVSYSKPAIWIWAVFWLVAFATCLISKTPSSSFVTLFQWFLLWNMPFVVACWLFQDKQSFQRFIFAVMLATVFIFILTVLEYMQRKPIWFGYIPSFLKIDGPLYHAIMQEQVRVGDDRYRARGVFAVHLYFAQFILLVTPFILHQFIESRGWKRFWSFSLLAFTLLIIWMTNTRTGMSGFILVCSGMIGLYALRRFLRPLNKSDMVAPAIFMAAPLAILSFVALVSISPRLQSMTIGGAQHRSSDLGRDMQWTRGMAALESNPLGYGANNSAPLAGRLAGDRYIIDSLWLNWLLDFGVLGFLAFFGFCVIAAYYGVLLYISSKSEADDLMGPAAVAVGGFVLTAYTISFAGNIPFMLILAGSIIAFRYSEKHGHSDAHLQKNFQAIESAPTLRAARKSL